MRTIDRFWVILLDGRVVMNSSLFMLHATGYILEDIQNINITSSVHNSVFKTNFRSTHISISINILHFQ